MPVIAVKYIDDYAVLCVRTKTGKEFETKIDLDNVERFQGLNWYQNAYGYVVARDPSDPRPGPNLHMQREVMHAEKGQVIDHEFGDQLDNRREFLRQATRKTNGQNRVKLSTKNTSGKTGVYWDQVRRKWIAQIKVDRIYIYLGGFEYFETAVEARRTAEDIHYGAFAPKI